MWQSVLGIVFVLGAPETSADAPDPAPKAALCQVVCHGKLRHGVVAVGGETTGTTISFNGMSWDLKFPDEVSRSAAKDHHKKPMTVVGSLRKVCGTTMKERWIVDVVRMTPRDAAQPEGALVTVHGTLQARTATTDEPSVMAIESGGIRWPLDLSAEKSMPAQAESLVGKPVVLEGQLEPMTDVKTPPQPIVRVRQLRAESTGAVEK